MHVFFAIGLSDSSDALKEVRSETIASGAVIHKYQQIHKGLRVYGSNVVLETNDHGFTGDADGGIYEGMDDDVPDAKPSISKQRAFDIAIKHRFSNVTNFNASSAQYDLEEDIELEYYTKEDEEVFHLVYNLVFLVDTDEILARTRYFIDAISGDVISYYEEIRKLPILQSS